MRARAKEPAFARLVAQAAARYRPAGRAAYYFARGKLNGDPVFSALLRDGRMAPGARIVDIGCGCGILAALLAAAERCDPRSAFEWPCDWAAPPSHWTLHGFDLRAGAVEVGQLSLADLGAGVSLSVGDARDAVLPPCDAAVALDVLHYIVRDAQRNVLANVHAALAPGGTLLMRVGDASSTRFRFTWLVDWWFAMVRNKAWPRLHCRPLAEWKSLLESIGFSTVAQPMSEGTPFANVLLIATKKG